MLLYSILFAVLTPFILVLGGRILYKNADCDINRTFGYRTSRSMSRRDGWIFANKLCGKILFYDGMAAAVISICAVILAYVILGEEAVFLTSVTFNILTAVMVIAVIPYIENQLKKFLAKENNNDKN